MEKRTQGVSLWKNERWEKGSKLPVLRGKITIPEDFEPGETYDIALWPNTSPTSEKSPQLTGKLSLPYEKPKPARASKPAAEPSFDDDLPF